MRRRDFISLFCGTTLSLQSVARAQTVKIPRMGILWHAPTAEAQEPYYRAILEGFRDLGTRGLKWHGRRTWLFLRP